MVDTSEGSFVCPRHVHNPVFNLPEKDTWQNRHGKFHSCSYCGSIHPDEFMQAIDDGAELGATDKDYKVYLRPVGGGQEKFYFYHLSDEQKLKFVELYNGQKLKMSGGYNFYVLPFFMKLKPV